MLIRLAAPSHSAAFRLSMNDSSPSQSCCAISCAFASSSESPSASSALDSAERDVLELGRGVEGVPTLAGELTPTTEVRLPLVWSLDWFP